MAHQQYMTYHEYLKSCGDPISEAEFRLLEFRARKRIDYLTDSRVQNMQSVPESVKLCVASLIGIEKKAGIEAQIDNPVVTSFSNDGYSESYGKALSVGDVERTTSSMIRSMLWGETDDKGIPLLYRGLDA